MEWEAVYLEPVQDFVLDQTEKVQAKILHYVDMLEGFGLNLGRPYVDKLTGTDLWELRIPHSSNIYRIFYFAYTGRKFILVHGFVEKTLRNNMSGACPVGRRVDRLEKQMDRLSDK